MKKITWVLLVQLIVFQIQFIRAQSIKETMLSNGIIYTKTDTIKCFIPIDDNLQSIVKYKTRKEDPTYQKISTDEIIALKRGVNTYISLDYKGEKILFKLLVQGTISLFERNSSFVKSTGSSSSNLPTMASDPRIYFISDSLQICKLNRMNFKDEIKKMLVGGESFYEEIDRLKYDDLPINLSRIISNYNFKVKDM